MLLQIISPEFDLSKLPNLTFSAREGTPAKLKIPIKGIPQPTVKWVKGEDDLNEDTRICVESTEVSTILIFKQILKDDAGVYKLLLFNSFKYIFQS